MTISRTALFLPGLALAAALVSPSVTLAQEAEVKQCATQWIAAKANPKFYQPWQDYFTECKKRLAAEPAGKTAAEPPQPEATKAEPLKAAPAVAAPAPAPTPAPAAEAAKPAKPAHKPKKAAQHKPQ